MALKLSITGLQSNPPVNRSLHVKARLQLSWSKHTHKSFYCTPPIKVTALFDRFFGGPGPPVRWRGAHFCLQVERDKLGWQRSTSSSLTPFLTLSQPLFFSLITVTVHPPLNTLQTGEQKGVRVWSRTERSNFEFWLQGKGELRVGFGNLTKIKRDLTRIWADRLLPLALEHVEWFYKLKFGINSFSWSQYGIA